MRKRLSAVQTRPLLEQRDMHECVMPPLPDRRKLYRHTCECGAVWEFLPCVYTEQETVGPWWRRTTLNVVYDEGFWLCTVRPERWKTI